MTEANSSTGPGRLIRQERSLKTYETFVATGFKQLHDREFESLTIAGLCRAAGYSVGAFYARFTDKDEFFEALVAQHLADRNEARDHLLETVSPDALLDELIKDLVQYYWRRRGFWRAVLMRSARDPVFFEPINRHGAEFVEIVSARIASDAGRPLMAQESANIAFALHMVLGMINNRIVNRPRPSLIGHATFIQNLTRAFRLVSGYDGIVEGNASTAN